MSEFASLRLTAPVRLPGTPPVRPEHVDDSGVFEVVVPYTGLDLTAKVVERAAALAAGLNTTLKLVDVYVAPYPAELRCPLAMQKFLTDRLTELAEKAGLPASVHLVVCRDRNEGFLSSLRPGSTVVIGSRKRFWRTRDEKLAERLVRRGHHVSLIHFD